MARSAAQLEQDAARRALLVGKFCTALITSLRERHMRPCGKPASWIRIDGAPRCAKHTKGKPQGATT